MSDARKTILVSGASGLIGRALCLELTARGHRARKLSRARGDVLWNPSDGRIDAGALDGIDTVVHLAGEGVAQRWSPDVRKRILRSRVDGADLLVRQILRQERPLDFISSSGTNYYGYEQGQPVDEQSVSGTGFLAEVCRAWESAARPLEAVGQRVALVRAGVVLSPRGGALKKLLPPFKAGLGGRLGSGRQMMSWISLADLVQVYLRCIEDRQLSGPINAVAPAAVTNREFTKALGRMLKRPTILPLPSAIIKILFGEMGRETLLSNLEVLPTRLEEAGFTWRHPDIETALKACLRT